MGTMMWNKRYKTLRYVLLFENNPVHGGTYHTTFSVSRTDLKKAAYDLQSWSVKQKFEKVFEKYLHHSQKEKCKLMYDMTIQGLCG